MKNFVTLISIFFFLSQLGHSAPTDSAKMLAENKGSSDITQIILSRYSTEYANVEDVELLRADTLKLGGQAVPALIEVMKNGKYPDKNRWVATFLLGQIMGQKSAPFVAKFMEHPSWVMRMASLKTLLALKQDKYASLYSKALTDESLIVRSQALENIRELNLKGQAPQVWAMLYDTKNYYKPTVANNDKKDKKDKKDKAETDESIHKRSHLIKKVITTVGDLQFEKAREPLFKMIQNDRYNDIFEEIDYALNRIVDKKSPEGTKEVKRRFWERTALSYKTF